MRETSQEALTTIQEKMIGHRQGQLAEKQMDFGCVLQVEPTRFVDGLEVWCEKKKGVRDDDKAL